MSALEKQIGGGHYKNLKIQPMEYSMANDLDPCQHTAIKYITRFRDKDGIKDLDKAIHCIEMLKEFYLEEVKAKTAAASAQVEWPEDESRIDVIGQNGPSALHYAVTNPPAFVLSDEEMQAFREQWKDANPAHRG